MSNKNYIRIAELKANLTLTDYVAIKIAEGVADRETYKDILQKRQEWRNEINMLEGEANGT